MSLVATPKESPRQLAKGPGYSVEFFIKYIPDRRLEYHVANIDIGTGLTYKINIQAVLQGYSFQNRVTEVEVTLSGNKARFNGLPPISDNACAYYCSEIQVRKATDADFELRGGRVVS